MVASSTAGDAPLGRDNAEKPSPPGRETPDSSPISYRLHRLSILAAALLFSTGGAAIKATTLSSWQVASFRSGVAALFLLLAIPQTRRFWSPRTLTVAVAYAATLTLFVTANKLTTAANAIFLQSTAPIYLLLLGPCVLRETVRRADLLFALGMAVGMALFFVGTESPTSTAPDPALGNLVGAASGLTWAVTLLGLRWLGRNDTNDSSAAQAVVAGNVFTCLACLPLALPVTSHSPTDWTMVGFLGVFQIGIAYIFMTRGMRGVPALEASLLLLLEPVASVFWAWSFHGETPGSWSLAGCVLILVSTVSRVAHHRW